MAVREEGARGSEDAASEPARDGAALSLIVCTYRRPRQVATLLAALPQQTRRPDEVLVVDGSPDEETERAVAALAGTPAGERLRYLRVPPEARGLTRQRNYGVTRAAGAVIAFLDDDTVPEPAYFAEVLACFERHPEAVGVGGFQTGLGWRPVRPGAPRKAPLSVYRRGGFERREDLRWRLRRLLGLAPEHPPGHMPPMGHPRPVGYLPPDGRDHPVESVMGFAMAWRRALFDHVRYSPYFEGYGLYEDLDFALRALERGPIYLATRARLRHDHAPAGRPRHWRYGVMVSRNGWMVWRRRWPRPPVRDRLRWWATSALLAAVRATSALRGEAAPALAESAGRFWGLATVLFSPPRDSDAGEPHAV